MCRESPKKVRFTGIRTLTPGLIFFKGPPVFALFYFVFEGNFQVQAPPPRGEGRFNGGFFALRVWGAYIWRGLFSEFYCIFRLSFHICISCVLYREVQRYEIHVQSNTALRKPRYYGQFALPSGK